MLTNVTRRDGYFLGYADAYRDRIKTIDRQNAEWQQVVDKWPNGSSAQVLRQRIESNNRERKALSAKISRIMANVRR